MKGGVTHRDMDERREALRFLKWMRDHVPDTFSMLWESFVRETSRSPKVKDRDAGSAVVEAAGRPCHFSKKG